MAVVLNSALHKINKDCTCATCRNLWKGSSHKHAAQISHLSHDKASADVTYAKLNGSVRKGDRALVNGSALERKGDRSYPVYSSHNGVYQGKRYFFCPRGHGAIVRCSDIQPLNPVPRTWPLSGNQMFPSYEGVKRRRKLREQKIKEAEEKLYKEHEANRRAQMERFSKSATQFSISDNANKIETGEILQQDDQDRHSIDDNLTGDRQKQAHNMNKDSLEELRSMKKAFGGDERAERMAQTLRKLRRAFAEGRLIALEEKE